MTGLVNQLEETWFSSNQLPYFLMSIIKKERVIGGSCKNGSPLKGLIVF